jgi:hypothetical protein
MPRQKEWELFEETVKPAIMQWAKIVPDEETLVESIMESVKIAILFREEDGQSGSEKG